MLAEWDSDMLRVCDDVRLLHLGGSLLMAPAHESHANFSRKDVALLSQMSSAAQSVIGSSASTSGYDMPSASEAGDNNGGGHDRNRDEAPLPEGYSTVWGGHAQKNGVWMTEESTKMGVDKHQKRV